MYYSSINTFKNKLKERGCEKNNQGQMQLTLQSEANLNPERPRTRSSVRIRPPYENTPYPVYVLAEGLWRQHRSIQPKCYIPQTRLVFHAMKYINGFFDDVNRRNMENLQSVFYNGQLYSIRCQEVYGIFRRKRQTNLIEMGNKEKRHLRFNEDARLKADILSAFFCGIQQSQSQPEDGHRQELSKIFRAMGKIEQNELRQTIRVVSLCTARTLSSCPERDDPILLKTWSTYYRHWGTSGLDQTQFIASYQSALQRARAVYGVSHEYAVSVLCDFVEAAQTVCQDKILVQSLARELWERTATSFYEVLPWSSRARGLATAALALAQSSLADYTEARRVYTIEARARLGRNKSQIFLALNPKPRPRDADHVAETLKAAIRSLDPSDWDCKIVLAALLETIGRCDKQFFDGKETVNQHQAAKVLRIRAIEPMMVMGFFILEQTGRESRMSRRLLNTAAVLAAVLAALLAALKLKLHTTPDSTPNLGYLPGKNNTVLFLTNVLAGLSNVHLATAQSLIERHPSIRVHYASFPEMSEKIARVSSLARMQNVNAPDITFHAISGQSYIDAILVKGRPQPIAPQWAGHEPGFKGCSGRDDILQSVISPWEGDPYRSLYNETRTIIDTIDPDVVVLDYVFRPAVEAVRGANRRHAFIAPGSLSDDIAFDQPYGQGFWKYPSIGSDMPFPIPWLRIPENIYLGLRYTYSVNILPRLRRPVSLLRKEGVYALTPMRDGRAPWIAPHISGATLPLDTVPKGVVGTNSIILRTATAAQQDPELADWFQRAPTLLINLGIVLAQTKVLWKFSPNPGLNMDFRAPLEEYVAQGRLRISTWLTIDAIAMFETGQIVASVHHGGANSYHEALAGGVPHVVVTMWVDLYNYAMLAEMTGVGVYATRGTAPRWTVAGLTNAFLAVVDGPRTEKMQQRAQDIAQLMQKEPGSHKAAKLIAGMATQEPLDV
ncbi:UDP-glucoronosyl and UDP-glucosyl transferase [Apiospora arundinis]